MFRGDLKPSLRIQDKFISLLFGLLLAVSVPSIGWANSSQPFFERYMALIERHKLVKAAESDIAASRERIQSEIGGWYPKINLSAFYGKEHQKNAANRTASVGVRSIGAVLHRNTTWV